MPSVSQLTAARKAAKARRVIEKQTRANIGAGCGRDRNRTAAVKAAQARCRLAMQKGTPADSDTRFYDLMRNHLHLQELVYTPENRSITIGVFEKTIRAMRITAALYQDDKLQRATKEAEAVLNRTNEAAFDALSPNQKRAFLHPLAVLCAFAEHYGATVPAATVQVCGYYNAAVQFCLYMAALYDRPLWQVEAVFAVAKGASIRALAKERGIKENTLRDTILEAAHCFYKVCEAVCPQTTRPADTIPSLRRAPYTELADYDTLHAQGRHIVENFLIPFETQTGITLINYRDFADKIVRVQTQH